MRATSILLNVGFAHGTFAHISIAEEALEPARVVRGTPACVIGALALLTRFMLALFTLHLPTFGSLANFDSSTVFLETPVS